MPRRVRTVIPGMAYHVINRAAQRIRLFSDPSDYETFLNVIALVQKQTPCRLLSFCLMPNHWHLLFWPETEEELPIFMQKLTAIHGTKWRGYRKSVGLGPVYQGRYKSFPVQNNFHFLSVARYIERNALRANLVTEAQQWRWSSLAMREGRTSKYGIELAEWPVACPVDWLLIVNKPQSQPELDALRRSVNKGTPFGDSVWQLETSRRLGKGKEGGRSFFSEKGT